MLKSFIMIFYNNNNKKKKKKKKKKKQKKKKYRKNILSKCAEQSVFALYIFIFPSKD